jgi:hypothetical protein
VDASTLLYQGILCVGSTLRKRLLITAASVAVLAYLDTR